jgi:hypothetical protein
MEAVLLLCLVLATHHCHLLQQTLHHRRQHPVAAQGRLGAIEKGLDKDKKYWKKERTERRCIYNL